MKKIYTVDPGTPREQRVAVELDEATGLTRVTLDPDTPQARTLEVDARPVPGGGLSLIHQGRAYDVDCTESDDQWSLLLAGRVFERKLLDQRKLRMARATGKGLGATSPELKTPMAGRVVAVPVAPGQPIKEGQSAVVVEAMKMENELKAHRDGVIGQINVSVGDVVEVGAVLLTIEDPPEGE